MCFGGCLHAERLMRSAVVVERDPIGDHSRGVLLGLEAMTMDALLFQGAAATGRSLPSRPPGSETTRC